MNIAKHKKYIGIKTELLITMMAISLFLTVGIILCMTVIISNTYDTKISKDNENITTLISENLSSFVDKAYKVSETLSQDPRILSMDSKIQTDVLKDTISKNEYFELLSIEDATGMQISKSEGEVGDRSDKWWFKQMSATQKPFVSKSFYSITSGKPITSVFMPLFDGDRFIGMMGCDFSLDYLQQLVEKYSENEDGRYSFVIDGEGAVIAHPDTEIIEQLYNYKTLSKTVTELDSNNSPIKDESGNIKTKQESITLADGYKQIISDVMSGNSGSIKFKDLDKYYYASYTPIVLSGQSDNWSIVTVQQELTAKSIIFNIIKTTIVAGFVILIFSILITLLVANKITKPIIEVSHLLTKASTGDFTVKSKIRSRNEVGILSLNFNEMVEKISSLLNEAKMLSENIKSSSEILNDKTEISARAANQIKIAVSEIAAGASNQASDSQKCANLSSNMAEKFETLTHKSQMMISESSTSNRIIEDGVSKVEDLKSKAEITVKFIKDTQTNIDNLHQKSKIIGTILENLNSITKQTKMLSLNASIESARAGEAGKGFTVVANQIGKLSDSSKELTQNITDILSDFQLQIKDCAEMMNSIKDISAQQFESVTYVNEAFGKVTNAITNIENIIDDIGNFINEMNIDNNSVVSSVGDIASISEQTAASSQQMAASIEQQTQSILRISKQTEDLKQRAILLDGEIGKFKV